MELSDEWSELADARLSFARFVEAIAHDARVVVLHDSDADGVSAAAVLVATLERLGFSTVLPVAPGRERDAWSPPNIERVAAARPDALFVLDLGSREEPLADVPTCLIDHHRPNGVPPGATLISGYSWRPVIPNTSLIVWELCRTMASIDDLDWTAAIGVLSDLGEKAPVRLLERVKERYRMSALKELTTIVNAARRASSYEPELALGLLRSTRDPAELLKRGSAALMHLQRSRKEVQLELAIAKKAAPVFSGRVALVRVSSPCQVHPVIAQIWRTRLPKYIVIVANDAYLPGRVNFSMRASGDTNLLDFLGGFDLGEGEGSYGRGHDQATGGSVSYEQWNRLLDLLNFPQELHVNR